MKDDWEDVGEVPMVVQDGVDANGVRCRWIQDRLSFLERGLNASFHEEGQDDERKGKEAGSTAKPLSMSMMVRKQRDVAAARRRADVKKAARFGPLLHLSRAGRAQSQAKSQREGYQSVQFLRIRNNVSIDTAIQVCDTLCFGYGKRSAVQGV